ncbi:MAG: AzlD domain-containing protein [Gudongella sp.]|nr:AzlD domain-containing protein [Gudongella sp.]
MFVTYIPRVFPLLFLSNKKINPKLERFLKLIPYTSLSILIIRGILTLDFSLIPAAIIGIGTSGFLSYRFNNLVLSVFIGIMLSFLVINFL